MSTSVQNETGIKAMYLPEEIVIDEVVDVRPYSHMAGDTDEELDAIERLAQSIEDEGQLQPVRVRLDDAGAPHLIMGHRRVRAIHLLNMRGDKPVPVRCEVAGSGGTTTDAEAFRQAALENIQRKQMSAMDLAGVIEKVREVNGWTGTKGTSKVANWLKVSPATVTQHEKLLKLDEDKQKLVHTGVLSAEAAMELQANVKPEEQAAVIEDARREQAAAIEDKGAGKGAGKGKGKAERATAAIKVKHIRRASRKRDAMLQMKALTKQEMMSVLEEVRDKVVADDPAACGVYGWKDGAVGRFLRSICSWADGKVGDATMLKELGGVASALPKSARGTPPPKQVKAEKMETAVAKPKKGKNKEAKPRPKK